MNINERYWIEDSSDVLNGLETHAAGLSSDEAERRLGTFGHNVISSRMQLSRVSLLAGQFKSPIILLLLFACAISAFVRDFVDSAIILLIVGASGVLSFYQEYSASVSVEKLLQVVKVRADVMRDGTKKEVFIEEVVPGDIVLLGAGSVIPADCLLLEAKDFFVNEAILTGETFPVEKAPGAVNGNGTLTGRKNSVFKGTNVISGAATAVAVRTGQTTEIGGIAAKLTITAPETDFERGVRRFGYLLLEATLVLVIIVFAVNTYFHRQVIEALLFSLALAVGLTPQLLPAIITVNLAKGSQKMSGKGVIVKRLASIENFGTMDILCTDKTGTITEGAVSLHGYCDALEEKNDRIPLYAYMNAFYQTGLENLLDKAVLAACAADISGFSKVDEIPYDFRRKRLSVVVRGTDGTNILITKGALEGVLDSCAYVEAGGLAGPIEGSRAGIERLYDGWSKDGLRVLGIAYKKVQDASAYKKTDEHGMTFLGFLRFYDPPKSDAKEVIEGLEELGIEVKIITGDNRHISAQTARSVGFPVKGILTGAELDELSDEAALHAIERASIFAEVDPNQKEKIILALKKRGNVVGFLGDGINDATALHAADVGISVNTAADVAKEASDIVLLEKDLSTLRDGVVEGRKTFANTLKYVFMATSANFGNMFSVAGASLFLPFLPMLPKQILLTNLLTDFPEMTIATDEVDAELVAKPRKWDIAFIKRFMIFFGVLSSIFDYVTFGVLLYALKAPAGLFRTGWFVESVLSASFVVMVLRTRKPFYRSSPGKYLLATTLCIGAATLLIPYMPFAQFLGFVSLPPLFIYSLGGILASYIILTEMGKRVFYARYLGNGD